MLRNMRWISKQDVLHLHLTQSAVLGTIIYWLRSWARAVKPTIIETYHGVGMNIPRPLRSVHAWNCRRRDAMSIMVLDTFWSNFMSRNAGLLSGLILNGVDAPVGPASTDSVRAYLANEIPPTAKRIIGTVGQFRPERQPLEIARILIEVLKSEPSDVHALMCGSGPELSRVRAMVGAAGMSVWQIYTSRCRK